MSDNALALHEAAHGVCGHALDDPATLIELNGASGKTWHGPGDLEPLPIDEWVALVCTQPDAERRLRIRLWCALAGHAADRRDDQQWTWMTSQQDRAFVHQVCLELQTPPWVVFPRVQQRIREAWPAVTALADELSWCRRLEGKAIDAIVSPLITRGSWLSEIDQPVHTSAELGRATWGERG